MNTVNVHLILLINHTKSHRTSFIKQKYLTEITSTLNSLKLIIPCYWQNFSQTFGKGVEKNVEYLRLTIEKCTSALGQASVPTFHMWAQVNVGYSLVKMHITRNALRLRTNCLLSTV